MNWPIYIWIAIFGGFAIGFLVGGKLGFNQGLSWEIKFYKKARIKGQVVEFKESEA